MAKVEPFALPPTEAIKWFRQRGYALNFDWRDMMGAAHSQAFTVAKATQLDVLADIRGAVDTAIAEGKTLAEFQKALKPLLQQKGWWGEKEQLDPKTGELKTVQLGSARRLRTIYDTNLRQAHSAGKWERAQRLKATRPYLRYVTIGDDKVRDEHKQWANIVRPVDDSFWDHATPMNGWGDRCKTQQLNDRDLARYGFKVSEPVEFKYKTWTNERTGEVMRLPEGISPGFDFNPGKSRGFMPPDSAPVLTPVRTFVDYARPTAAAISPTPKAPANWPAVHTEPDKARQRERFRQLFEIPSDRDFGTVRDPLGVEIIFSLRYLEHLLMNEPTRTSFITTAKATVESPYEIWMVPFRMRDGTVQMRLRYIGAFDDKGHVVVVDRQRDGSVMHTSYPRRSLDGQRRGYLLYPQPKEGT